MGKIVVFENLTLDGVMQAPGRPDADRREGFQHGGWATPYADPVSAKAAGEGMAGTGGLLLGRRTYEEYSAVGPEQTDSPFADWLNSARKYVASTTLEEPLAWRNSTLLKGDVAEAIAELKAESDTAFVVLSSGELVQTLMKHDLVEWFDGQLEEAMAFYTSIFKDSSVDDVKRYSETGPGPAGTALSAKFHLGGVEFMGINGGPEFSFTPAVSFFVKCETQEEVDELWEKLLDGGEPQMCSWLTDKYGVSWQIVPTALDEMLSDDDPKRVEKVTEAMPQMVKLDIQGLRDAYNSV
ncbi:MAG: VOC family protein [Anaerolineae bacterium]